MQELRGKVIQKIILNNRNTIIVFLTEKDKNIIYETGSRVDEVGWFSSIEGRRNLLGREVSKVIKRKDGYEIWTIFSKNEAVRNFINRESNKNFKGRSSLIGVSAICFEVIKIRRDTLKKINIERKKGAKKKCIIRLGEKRWIKIDDVPADEWDTFKEIKTDF